MEAQKRRSVEEILEAIPEKFVSVFEQTVESGSVGGIVNVAQTGEGIQVRIDAVTLIDEYGTSEDLADVAAIDATTEEDECVRSYAFELLE